MAYQALLLQLSASYSIIIAQIHGHVPIITDTCKYHMSNMHRPQNLTRLPCKAHASPVPGLAISLGMRL